MAKSRFVSMLLFLVVVATATVGATAPWFALAEVATGIEGAELSPAARTAAAAALASGQAATPTGARALEVVRTLDALHDGRSMGAVHDGLLALSPLSAPAAALGFGRAIDAADEAADGPMTPDALAAFQGEGTPLTLPVVRDLDVVLARGVLSLTLDPAQAARLAATAASWPEPSREALALVLDAAAFGPARSATGDVALRLALAADAVDAVDTLQLVTGLPVYDDGDIRFDPNLDSNSLDSSGYRIWFDAGGDDVATGDMGGAKGTCTSVTPVIAPNAIGVPAVTAWLENHVVPKVTCRVVRLYVDAAGDDTYVAPPGPARPILGAGANGGYGFFLDATGDDRYEVAAAPGGDGFFGSQLVLGGGFHGGRGHFVDLAGDDVYNARDFGVAVNWPFVFFAFPIDEPSSSSFVDAAGRADFPLSGTMRYCGATLGLGPVESRVAILGAGTTLDCLIIGSGYADVGSASLFVSGPGDDRYEAYLGLGCGHDVSVGVFVELGGTNRLDGGPFCGLGLGYGGAGIVLLGPGDDTLLVSGRGVGFANIGLGAVWDAGGRLTVSASGTSTNHAAIAVAHAEGVAIVSSAAATAIFTVTHPGDAYATARGGVAVLHRAASASSTSYAALPTTQVAVVKAGGHSQTIDNSLSVVRTGAVPNFNCAPDALTLNLAPSPHLLRACSVSQAGSEPVAPAVLGVGLPTTIPWFPVCNGSTVAEQACREGAVLAFGPDADDRLQATSTGLTATGGYLNVAELSSTSTRISMMSADGACSFTCVRTEQVLAAAGAT